MPYIIKYAEPRTKVLYLHILKDGSSGFYSKTASIKARYLLTKSEVDDLVREEELTDHPYITVEFVASEVEEYEPKERVICHI